MPTEVGTLYHVGHVAIDADASLGNCVIFVSIRGSIPKPQGAFLIAFQAAWHDATPFRNASGHVVPGWSKACYIKCRDMYPIDTAQLHYFALLTLDRRFHLGRHISSSPCLGSLLPTTQALMPRTAALIPYMYQTSLQGILRLCWPVIRSLEEHCSVGWSIRADLGSFHLLTKADLR